MKMILRNLLNIIKRFKLAYSLNLFGTAVAFAAFMAIMIQVQYEQKFDTCHSKADRIFRIDRSDIDSEFGKILPRGYIEDFMESSSHIESGVLSFNFNPDVYFVYQDNDGNQRGISQNVVLCTEGLTKIFDFMMVNGTANCLSSPDKLLIPASFAKRVFGTVDVVGKQIERKSGSWMSCTDHYTVGGVYEDFPANTQVRNTVYAKIDNTMSGNYGASNFIAYVLLDDDEAADAVADNYNKRINPQNVETAPVFHLTQLQDIYYKNEDGNGTVFQSGNMLITVLLVFIAMVVLLISIINHINFNLALVPMRMRSVSIQKVLGGSSRKLKLLLVAESVLTCALAWIVGCLLVQIVKEAWITSFLSADLSLNKNMQTIIGTGLLSLVIGFVAGMYPAYNLTTISPVVAFKGSFGMSPMGRKLRTFLVGLQFFSSFVFITASLFVTMQNKYMSNNKLSLSTDHVVAVKLDENVCRNNYSSFVNKMKSFPGITNVAFSMQKLAAGDTYCTYGDNINGEDISFFVVFTTPEILDVFDIDVVDGDNFGPNANQNPNVAIVTQSFKENGKLEIGDSLSQIKVAAVCQDVNIASMRKNNINTAFIVGKDALASVGMPYSYMRIAAGTQVSAVVDHITKVVGEIDPTYPVSVEFYDDILDNLYRRERSLESLVVFFSLLAIIISIIGIFTMVVFDCEYRRKETGIRRVLGASVESILFIFNRTYLKTLVITFIISIPVTWFLVHRWLQEFSYRISMSWYVFVLVFVVILLITVSVVSIQTLKAARENPVNSLRNE